MDLSELKTLWLNEEQSSFQGWDFSHLKGRWLDEQLPWDYKTIIQTYLHADQELLDMGTGGGEFLLSLNHPYHLTAVTEAYPPNIELCRQKLTPLGISVYPIGSDNKLPFADNRFDLIINRHEEYDITEVVRILAPGGLFITQQVGGANDIDLSRRLIDNFQPAFPQHDLVHNVRLFETAGLKIINRAEVFTPIRFYDIGAFVYFAKVIPWEFPGFTVERAFDKLLACQLALEQQGYLEGTEHRFLIAAQKP